MNLTEYISDEPRKQALALAVGTSPAYLYQIATGWKGKRPSPDLAKRIESASGIRCETLRPDLQWMRDKEGNVTGYFSPLDA
jgi:DNA-binding transcriptional regulator YdaS (Cro superfamily)